MDIERDTADPAQARATLALAFGAWGGSGPANQVVDAAVRALFEGLWTPELGELAGASASAPASDLAPLVERICYDLRLPWPPASASDPFPRDRPAPLLNELLLGVTRTATDWSAPAGMPTITISVDDSRLEWGVIGVSPMHLFHPRNRLVATEDSHQVTLFQCECGSPGCDDRDVRITRDGTTVWWEWPGADGRFTRVDVFDAAAYDAEVGRAASDTDWELPGETAERLVLDGADHARLSESGLRLTWSTVRADAPETMSIGLQGDGHQVLLDVDRAGRTPERWAAAVIAELARPPRQWRAQWLGNRPDTADTPPAIAGPQWRRWRSPGR